MAEQTHAINRVVIKVGSSVLTDASGRLLPERIEQLAAGIAACAAEHRQPLLISSGAIACGMARLGLTRRPNSLAQLQACAAIGQSELMHLYNLAFAKHRIVTAQVLLTQEDLSNQRRYHNAKQTILTLLHQRVVPIINENDTVAVEEITFGDNDRLAALVAAAVDAQLLIILSDVDGFLHNGHVVAQVETLSHLRASVLDRGGRSTTKGGMTSKLEAARIAGHSGIATVIANGTRPTVLGQLLAGESVGTLFVPPRSRLTPKKWWIAFSLRQPKGVVTIDAGAAEALLERGKSLLASGIQEVKGQFEVGECLAVCNEQGSEVARGLSNFSSGELRRIQVMKSAEAARTLGQQRPRAVIHRDHLVLAKEIHT